MYRYYDLYKHLLTKIQEGNYAPGEKLPTESQLTTWGYSRSTVRRALSELATQGYIQTRRGSGSVVNALPTEKKQSKQIALSFCTFDTYIFPELLKGITDELAGKYAALLFANNYKIEEEQRILQELLNLDIEGVIVQAFGTALPNPNLHLYQQLIDKGVSVVFLYAPYPSLTGFTCVANDDIQGGKLCVSHLYSAGRRKISGIFNIDSLQMHHRYEGFITECKKLNIELNSERTLWLQSHEMSESVNTKQKILSVTKDCDALVCSSDYVAIIAVKVLLDSGIRVPEDIAIISFDNSLYSELSPVPLTSLEGKPYVVGNIAAKKIINILSDKPETSVEIPWELVKRQSG